MWSIFVLLFVILSMIAITSSITLYNYYANQQRSYIIIKDISNKLDELHNESGTVINQTAHSSSTNTILLSQITQELHKTGNVTNQAHGVKLVEDSNKLLHQI